MVSAAAQLAAQFLEPVEGDEERGVRGGITHDPAGHEEALPVGADVVGGVELALQEVQLRVEAEERLACAQGECGSG